MEEGKCMTCGTAIMGFGYCYSCGVEAHDKLDKEFPYQVLDGRGTLLESFKTKSEAIDFMDSLKRCYVKDI